MGLFQGIDLSLIKRGEAFCLRKLSVDPQYMGRGLAKKLVLKSVNYLKNQGYKHAYYTVINKISKHLFESLGGQVINKIDVTYH
jgi:ribosomal protein S18 acetylase RimI-like enzyme